MPYPSHGDVHQELHHESKDQGRPTTSGKHERLKRVQQKLNHLQEQGATVAHLDLQQTRTCTRLWGSTPTHRGRSLRELHRFRVSWRSTDPTTVRRPRGHPPTRAKLTKNKACTRKQSLSGSPALDDPDRQLRSPAAQAGSGRRAIKRPSPKSRRNAYNSRRPNLRYKSSRSNSSSERPTSCHPANQFTLLILIVTFFTALVVIVHDHTVTQHGTCSILATPKRST